MEVTILRRIGKLIALLLGIAIPAYPHFFAQETMYNPETGQYAELFYDWHHSANLEIDPLLHQQQILERAQAYKKNTVVATEDMHSHVNHAALIFDPNIDNKNFINKSTQDFPAESPLSWSYAHCFIQDIPVINIECRPRNSDDPLEQKYTDELNQFNDTEPANTFYRSLRNYAREYTELEGERGYGEEFNYQALMIDARALHTILTHPNKHIVFLAGALHVLGVRHMLLKLGWQSISILVADGFDASEKETFLELVHNTGHYTNQPQVYVDADSYFMEYILTLQQHALDLTTVPLNTNFMAEPIPTHHTLSSLLTTFVHLEKTLWRLV